MLSKADFFRVADNIWEIPATFRNDMRVPARKGSTRAFGPGSSVLPGDLRDIGQPVLIPGSMGTARMF